MLFVVSDHPSLIVSLFPAAFWNAMFKHPFYLANVPEAISAMPAVLELATRKISKKVTASLSKENTVYFRHDFDGWGEFQEFSRLARGLSAFFIIYLVRYLDVVKSIIKSRPLDAFPWILERMKQRLTSIPEANSMINLNGKGHVTSDTPFYNHLEADVSVMNIVLQTLPSMMQGDAEGAQLQSQLLACSKELLEMVVKYATNDPLLIRLKIDMLVGFTPILPYDLGMVESCLGTIFGFASFVQPSEVGFLSSANFVDLLDQETRNIRNKSYSRLVCYHFLCCRPKLQLRCPTY
jgi:hypothetical protein